MLRFTLFVVCALLQVQATAEDESFSAIQESITRFLLETKPKGPVVFRIEEHSMNRLHLALDCRERTIEVRNRGGDFGGYETEYHPGKDGVYLFVEVKSIDVESVGHQDWKEIPDRRLGNYHMLVWYRPIKGHERRIYHIHGRFGTVYNKTKAIEFLNTLFDATK